MIRSSLLRNISRALFVVTTKDYNSILASIVASHLNITTYDFIPGHIGFSRLINARGEGVILSFAFCLSEVQPTWFSLRVTYFIKTGQNDWLFSCRRTDQWRKSCRECRLHNPPPEPLERASLDGRRARHLHFGKGESADGHARRNPSHTKEKSCQPQGNAR